MKTEKEIQVVVDEITQIRDKFVELDEKQQMYVAGIIEGMLMMKPKQSA